VASGDYLAVHALTAQARRVASVKLDSPAVAVHWLDQAVLVALLRGSGAGVSVQVRPIARSRAQSRAVSDTAADFQNRREDSRLPYLITPLLRLGLGHRRYSALSAFFERHPQPLGCTEPTAAEWHP
jgi:hypothetical protein